MSFNESSIRRDVAGRFSETAHSKPEATLDSLNNDDLEWRPGEPLAVEVVLEMWGGRKQDQAIEVGVAEFDAVSLLDQTPVSELPWTEGYLGDEDFLFEQAVDDGLVEAHHGPFTVRKPDGYDDYVRDRRQNAAAEAEVRALLPGRATSAYFVMEDGVLRGDGFADDFGNQYRAAGWPAGHYSLAPPLPVDLDAVNDAAARITRPEAAGMVWATGEQWRMRLPQNGRQA